LSILTVVVVESLRVTGTRRVPGASL